MRLVYQVLAFVFGAFAALLLLRNCEQLEQYAGMQPDTTLVSLDTTLTYDTTLYRFPINIQPQPDTTYIPHYVDTTSDKKLTVTDTNALIQRSDTFQDLVNFYKARTYTNQYSDSQLQLNQSITVYKNKLDTVKTSYRILSPDTMLTRTREINQSTSIHFVPLIGIGTGGPVAGGAVNYHEHFGGITATFGDESNNPDIRLLYGFKF